jgi:predicted lipid-binding transport protein (Tim44 family)
MKHLSINAILILLVTSVIFGLTSCQKNSASENKTVTENINKTVSNANQNTANKTETNSNAADAPKAETKSTSVSASTPTEAYKSAYAARKNKDIETLKKLIAKDMFEFFEILGEGKENPVDAGLKEMCESPQGPTDEVRNEKINGDKATLQYLDKDSKWATLDLVKEDGIWKLTIAKMNDDKKTK